MLSVPGGNPGMKIGSVIPLEDASRYPPLAHFLRLSRNLLCHSLATPAVADNRIGSRNVEFTNKKRLQQFCAPGGVLLLSAAVLLHGGIVTIPAAAIDFYYYTVFVAALLLAWRFHSSRVMFVLLTLLLAHRSLEFFSNGRMASTGPGRIAFEAIAFLLPINLVLFSQARERGWGVPAIASRLGLLFFEAIFVALICRPGATTSPWFIHAAILKRGLFSWTPIPQLALLVFALSFAVLLIRLMMHSKPLESGLLWSLAAAFAGLQVGGVGRIGSAYFATSGLILLSSIVENTYLLAYHDELTGLPSRRAFNDALLRLEAPYAIAVADIDHFKKFNDTFGHDTGDQVLRMVGTRLAEMTGGGQAYRVGGEEFCILFRDKSMKESLPHLEALRVAVQESVFHLRALPERRSVTRGADRRSTRGRRVSSSQLLRRAQAEPSTQEFSVTVSMGIAEPSPGAQEFEQVVQAADKALYRAKRGGRNRIEAATPSRTRGSRFKRSIA
jgi:diguanylate cyclase (GGDEF)-like protein